MSLAALDAPAAALDFQWRRYGLTPPPVPTDGAVLVDWQAPGWRYLQVAATDSTNRSVTSYIRKPPQNLVSSFHILLSKSTM